jgi:hypothetical protein
MTDGFRTALPAPTDRLDLGDTGMRVSPLCLGMVSDPATVSAAYEVGVNFFFVTCDMHWPLYENLRRGLADLFARGGGVRDDVVVAAVTYVAQPEFLWMPFEEVVAALPGLDRIDVLVAGGTYLPDLLPRTDVLADNRDNGLVAGRAIGASFHDRTAARTCIERGLLDIAYLRYNAGHPGALAEVFPHIGAPRRTLAFNFKSTDGYVDAARLDEVGLPDDLWRPSIEDHYRFALSRTALDGVLCAPRTPRELDSLLAALARGPLSAVDEEYLIKLAMLASGEAELDADS